MATRDALITMEAIVANCLNGLAQKRWRLKWAFLIQLRRFLLSKNKTRYAPKVSRHPNLIFEMKTLWKEISTTIQLRLCSRSEKKSIENEVSWDVESSLLRSFHHFLSQSQRERENRFEEKVKTFAAVITRAWMAWWKQKLSRRT